jgi:DNA mismatch repair protein MutL
VVAQQVAAGEVVERPASVIKELVENALDAGASRIEIEVGGDGATRIQVSDDGRGMGAEDAKLSVLRHATSKIDSIADLEAVSTLGFRGEALPSIASVSAFSLSTSTGEGAATKVSVDGGEEARVSSASHPRGTTVVVERLFYNVPARRAFLKGARSERAAIVEVVSHLAVSHPLVGFRLSEAGGAPGGRAPGGGAAGRERLSLPPAGDLRERLAQIYGVGKARAFRKVEHEVGPFRIDGFAALPSLTYTSRSSCQTVSVNGRWVRAEILTRALDDAYRATVPAGRYPPVALDVEVDPRKVDVNVHPTKQLVRFSDERAARKAVADAVKMSIEWGEQHSYKQNYAPGSSSPGSSGKPGAASPPAASQTSSGPGPVSTTSNRKTGAKRGQQGEGRLFERHAPRPSRQELENAARLPDYRQRIQESSRSPREESSTQQPATVADGPAQAVPGWSGWSAGAEPPERGDLPSPRELRVVGQVGTGYILVEEPGAVWVVDQHVAHERAILDRLVDSESPPSIQHLLVPEVVELSSEDAALATEHLEELSVYGFDVEPFGPNSVRVTSVISTLADRDVTGAFTQALSVIKGAEAGMTREERILATIACHSAVRLGDRLTQPEMEALIKDWLKSRLPATCPHGRSICYRIPLKEMARKLDRH